MAKVNPTSVSRADIHAFKRHYADLLGAGDDVQRNFRNQHGGDPGVPSRSRQALQIKLTELDYEWARFFGSGTVVHGIRRALAEARNRCCDCKCCNRIQLRNQRRDKHAEEIAARVARLIASGYWS